MDVRDREIVARKVARFILLGSAVLLICAVLLPTNRIIGSDLAAKVSNLVVAQAFADGGESSYKSGGSDKSGGGGGGGGSTDCLVCVPVSSTPLGSGSSGNSKSGEDNSKNSNKVSVCHSGGKSGNQTTLSIDSSAVPAHLAQGDSYGGCSNTIPTCGATTSSGVAAGIWVPSSAVGNDTALNAYFDQIQSGTPSGLQACSTTNATQSYRDIHGQ
jgi:hypothetical protein